MVNKVKYGIRNVHYALIGKDWAYETPKPIPQATSISLKPKSAELTVYGDDTLQTNKSISRGYTGSISFNELPDEFYVDVFGQTVDSKGVLTENVNDNPHEAALLFEFSGDPVSQRHVLYRVSFARPNIESEGMADKISTKEFSIDITVMPVVGGDLDGKIKGRLYDTTETHDTYTTWFTQVYTAADGVTAS